MAKTNTISVRIPRKLYDELREMAREVDASITQLVTQALHAGLSFDRKEADFLVTCSICGGDCGIFIYGSWGVTFCSNCSLQGLLYDTTKLVGNPNLRKVEK